MDTLHTHTTLCRYLMHHVHSKIYPAVCQVHRKEDAQLVERCRQLRGNLTPDVVGVSSDYDCPYPFTLGKLNKLHGATSPLEKIHIFHDAVECVMEDAKVHFTKSLRLGGVIMISIKVVGVVYNYMDCRTGSTILVAHMLFNHIFVFLEPQLLASDDLIALLVSKPLLRKSGKLCCTCTYCSCMHTHT